MTEPENELAIADEKNGDEQLGEFPFAPFPERSGSGKFGKAEVRAWFVFWGHVWLGATLAGGALGTLLGVFGMLFEPTLVLLGPIIGCAVAGGIGLLVVPTVGSICWMFWLQRRPLVLAGITGGLVGLFSSGGGAIVASPLGALGSYLAVRRFLKTDTGKTIVAHEERRLRGEAVRFHYSISDLFLRMTVVAVLISVWGLLIRVALSSR